MNIWNSIKNIMRIKRRYNPAPVLILQKDTGGLETKEYDSVEKAIADIESDRNIPKEKLENLRKSLDSLKHKNSIRIKNGEIID